MRNFAVLPQLEWSVHCTKRHVSLNQRCLISVVREGCRGAASAKAFVRARQELCVTNYLRGGVGGGGLVVMKDRKWASWRPTAVVFLTDWLTACHGCQRV